MKTLKREEIYARDYHDLEHLSRASGRLSNPFAFGSRLPSDLSAPMERVRAPR